MFNHQAIYQTVQSQVEQLRQAAKRQQLLKDRATRESSWFQRWKLYLRNLVYAEALIAAVDEIKRVQTK